MIPTILALIETANPNYESTFEEARMMNLRADAIAYDKGFAYVEEYRKGSYGLRGYVPTKTMTMQVYFCRFTEMHNTALQREEIRNKIESEIVRPFMETYNSSRIFEEVENWILYTPVPRFDANEVSIMLQFECRLWNPCITPYEPQ